MVERVIKAPREKVWNVASDFSKSPGPSISIVLEKDGNPVLNGVGMERTITFKNSEVYERLESFEPMKCFTYSIISGAPVKYYLGRAEFKSNGNNTFIRWSGEFVPKFPFIGWIVAKVTKSVINQFIDELERYEYNIN